MKSIPQYFPRADWSHLVVVFLFVFFVYLWSMPATVVLEDDGYFILASYFNSVTHPPGYPLFTLLGHLFTWIPAGSVAFHVHMASACFGALACVALWIFIKQQLQDRLCAYVGALGLGFSTTFWSQAIIAEVYTLNVLLFMTMLVLLQKCKEVPEHGQSTCIGWLAFIYGLSLSNHWPLILLSTPALALLLWPLRKRIVNGIFAYLLFFLAGLLPYAWMIWRSHVVPEVSFYGPINNWQEFWFYVSRTIYGNVDYSQTATLLDKLHYAIFTVEQTIAQFGFFGILFAIAGIIWLWTERQSPLLLFTIVVYVCNTLLLILLLGFDFDYFHRATFMVYPLLAYTMGAIWMACGIKYAFVLVEKVGSRTIAIKYLMPALAVLVVGGTLLANIPHNFRRHDFLASDYAGVVLDSLEPQAIFYSNADNFDGPIEYLNRIEKVRQDVTVYTGRYLFADDKLYRPYQLRANELRKLVDHVIRSTDRPVYYTNDFPNTYARDRYGLFTKVNRERSATEPDRVIVVSSFIDLFRSWSRYRLVNTWDIMNYNLLRADYCDLLLTVEYANRGNTEITGLAEATDFICDNYQGVLNRLKFALQDPAATAPELELMLNNAQAYRDQAYTKEEISRLDYYRGLYYLRLGDRQRAQKSFLASFTAWPHPDNPARTMTTGFQ